MRHGTVAAESLRGWPRGSRGSGGEITLGLVNLADRDDSREISSARESRIPNADSGRFQVRVSDCGLRGDSRTVETDHSFNGQDGAFGFQRDVGVGDSRPEHVANGTAGDAYGILEISR
jgi:hypothetical protein